MKRINIKVSDAQFAALQQAAEDKNVFMADIIHEGLAFVIPEYTGVPALPRRGEYKREKSESNGK